MKKLLLAAMTIGLVPMLNACVIDPCNGDHNECWTGSYCGADDFCHTDPYYCDVSGDTRCASFDTCDTLMRQCVPYGYAIGYDRWNQAIGCINDNECQYGDYCASDGLCYPHPDTRVTYYGMVPVFHRL